MALARRAILPDEAYTHCTWSCINREFLMRSSVIKDYIVKTWRKYRKNYKVKFFEYCILDNHVHMIVQAASTELLGAFMRVCNSLIARFINKHLGRDSHALRERYKSPLIEGVSYFTNTMAYVWLNYYKATGIDPRAYQYGSAFYRIRGLDNKGLLSPYRDFLVNANQSERRFVEDLMNAAMSREVMKNLTEETYEHSHTIGSPDFVALRTRLLQPLRLLWKKKRGLS